MRKDRQRIHVDDLAALTENPFEAWWADRNQGWDSVMLAPIPRPGRGSEPASPPPRLCTAMAWPNCQDAEMETRDVVDSNWAATWA